MTPQRRRAFILGVFAALALIAGLVLLLWPDTVTAPPPRAPSRDRLAPGAADPMSRLSPVINKDPPADAGMKDGGG